MTSLGTSDGRRRRIVEPILWSAAAAAAADSSDGEQFDRQRNLDGVVL